MPEIRPGPPPDETKRFDRSSTVLVKLMDRFGLREHFSSEENTREYIQSLDFDSFVRLITNINGVFRETPIHERAVDGSTLAEVGFSFPPRKEDKLPLLHELFDAMRRMASSGAPMEHIAILLGATINAIHPFVDGNGRTSRFAYQLVKEPFVGSDREEILRGSTRETVGRHYIDFDSSVYRTYVYEYMARSIGVDPRNDQEPSFVNSSIDDDQSQIINQLLNNKGIDPKNRMMLLRVFARMTYHRETSFHGPGTLAFLQYANVHGCRDPYIHQVRRDDSRDPDLFYIDAYSMIGDLPVNDLAEIVENYFKFKRKFVQIVIDCIEHPEQYPIYPDEPDSPTVFSQLYFPKHTN